MASDLERRQKRLGLRNPSALRAQAKHDESEMQRLSKEASLNELSDRVASMLAKAMHNTRA
eukprot:324049-Pleurochrysis_carterae.AAC.1